MKKRFSLPRKWRLIRNLFVTAACIFAIWALSGYPLPTPELNYRRAERANLLQPAEILGGFRADGKEYVVAMDRESVIFFSARRPQALYVWPRSGSGPLLIPQADNRTEQRGHIVAADLPEGAASARLELTAACWYSYEWSGGEARMSVDRTPGDGRDQRWERAYTIQGRRQDDLFLFYVQGESPGPDPFDRERWTQEDIAAEEAASVERVVLGELFEWDWYLEEQESFADIRMEAVFYDENGTELDRAALSAPR